VLVVLSAHSVNLGSTVLQELLSVPNVYQDRTALQQVPKSALSAKQGHTQTSAVVWINAPNANQVHFQILQAHLSAVLVHLITTAKKQHLHASRAQLSRSQLIF
jgi:hypothetical protein